jgi:hypothetical protein
MRRSRCACSGSRMRSTSLLVHALSSGSVRSPSLGSKGPAIATSIGRGSGVLFQLDHLIPDICAAADHDLLAESGCHSVNGAGDTWTETFIHLGCPVVPADSARVGAGLPIRMGSDGRIRRRQRRGLSAGAGQRDDFQAGAVENQESIGVSSSSWTWRALCTLFDR